MFLPLPFKLQHLLCQRMICLRNLARRIMCEDAFSLGADFRRAY